MMFYSASSDPFHPFFIGYKKGGVFAKGIECAFCHSELFFQKFRVQFRSHLFVLGHRNLSPLQTYGRSSILPKFISLLHRLWNLGMSPILIYCCNTI